MSGIESTSGPGAGSPPNPPDDQLDRLLRPRQGGQWAQRLAAASQMARAPRVIAAAVVVATMVIGAWALIRSGSPPAALVLPRAGDQPSGVTVPAGAAVAADTPDAPDAADAAAGSGAGTSSTGVSVTTVPPFAVHVAGAVAAPGLVLIPSGSRVADAVSLAGGLRPDADLDRLNLAARLADGARVYIPVRGQPVPPDVSPGGSVGGGATPGAPGGADVSVGPTANDPLDINSASAADLEALPGVGPATASAIVAFRNENGPFGAVEELQDVRGIGPAKFDALAELVTVG